jgi:hypothetical protein
MPKNIFCLAYCSTVGINWVASSRAMKRKQNGFNAGLVSLIAPRIGVKLRESALTSS